MKPKVTAYLRVSTQEQNTELQKREIGAYLKACNITSFELFEDIGHSGTTDKRPELQRLLRAARSKDVGTVVVWKLDRFFRSLKHVISTLNEFEELGIGFVSVRDKIDLHSPSGRLMLHLLSAFGEFEAALIRERVISGLNNARAKGKRLGRPPVHCREQIVMLRQSGKTLQEIADKIGTSKGTVSKILKKFHKPSQTGEVAKTLV